MRYFPAIPYLSDKHRNLPSHPTHNDSSYIPYTELPPAPLTAAPEIGRNAHTRVAIFVPKKDIDTSLATVHIDTAPSNRGRRDEMASKWDTYVHSVPTNTGTVWYVAVWRDGCFYWKPVFEVRRANPSIRAAFGPLSSCPWRYSSRRAALAAARRQYVVED